MDAPNSSGSDGGVPTDMRSALRTVALPRTLHPIFVHYTIALTSSSLLFEVVGRLGRQPDLSTAAWWTLALGTVATILTLLTGVTARRRLEIGEGTARSYLRLHMALGPMVFGLLITMSLWRGSMWQTQATPGWWYLTALAITCGVMAVQGYSGGELVYRWGADVEGQARGLGQRHALEPPPVSAQVSPPTVTA